MTLDSQLPEHANQMAMLIAESLREESPFHPQYLNPKDAARFTSFTPKALERKRQRGEGPRYSKVGKSIRYALADLRAWVEADRADLDASCTARCNPLTKQEA